MLQNDIKSTNKNLKENFNTKSTGSFNNILGRKAETYIEKYEKSNSTVCDDVVVNMDVSNSGNSGNEDDNNLNSSSNSSPFVNSNNHSSNSNHTNNDNNNDSDDLSNNIEWMSGVRTWWASVRVLDVTMEQSIATQVDS